MHNDNMPQRGFNDVECAGVSFLDIIILAESLPARPEVARMLVWENMNLPRSGAAQWGLEGDCACFRQTNRIAESRW